MIAKLYYRLFGNNIKSREKAIRAIESTNDGFYYARLKMKKMMDEEKNLDIAFGINRALLEMENAFIGEPREMIGR